MVVGEDVALLVVDEAGAGAALAVVEAEASMVTTLGSAEAARPATEPGSRLISLGELAVMVVEPEASSLRCAAQ